MLLRGYQMVSVLHVLNFFVAVFQGAKPILQWIRLMEMHY
jgi:hypothetical protein